MTLQSLKFPSLISHMLARYTPSTNAQFRLYAYSMFRASTPVSIQSVYARSFIKDSRLEGLVKWFVAANHGETRFSFASPKYQGNFYEVASRLSFNNGSNIAGAIVNPGESLVIDFSDCWIRLLELYTDFANDEAIVGLFDKSNVINDYPTMRVNGEDKFSLFSAVVNLNGALGSDFEHSTYATYKGGEAASEPLGSTYTVRNYLYSNFSKSAQVFTQQGSPSRQLHEHPDDVFININSPTSGEECCSTCLPAAGGAGDTLEVFQDGDFTLDISSIATDLDNRIDVDFGVRIVNEPSEATNFAVETTSLNPDDGLTYFETRGSAINSGIGLEINAIRFQEIRGPFPTTVTLCHTYSTRGYQFYMRTFDGYTVRVCINFDAATNTITLHSPTFLSEDVQGEELYGVHQYFKNPPVGALTPVDISTLTVDAGSLVLPMNSEVDVDLPAVVQGQVLDSLSGVLSLPLNFKWTVPANPGRFEWTFSATPLKEDGTALYPISDTNGANNITGSFVGASPWGRAEGDPYFFVSNDGMEAGEEASAACSTNVPGVNSFYSGDPTTTPLGVYKVRYRLYESTNCGLPTFSDRGDFASLVSELPTGDGSSGTPYLVTQNSAVDAIQIPSTSTDVHFRLININTEDLQVRVFSSPSTNTLPGIGAGLCGITVYDDAAFSNELSSDDVTRPYNPIYSGLVFGDNTNEWLNRGEESPLNTVQTIPNEVYIRIEFPDTSSTYLANRIFYVEFFEKYNTKYGKLLDFTFDGNGTLADPYVLPLNSTPDNVAFGSGDTDNAVYFSTFLDYTVETTLNLVTSAATALGSSGTTIELYSDPAYTVLVASNVGAPYASLSDATLLSGAIAYYKIFNNLGNDRGGFQLSVTAS